jgi:PilZ domain-containing protein
MHTSLRQVADVVTRRARRQGFVLPEEIREELTRAGLNEDDWKEVIALARPALRLRQGRYEYVSPSDRRLEEAALQQRAIERAVRQLLRQYRQRSMEPGDRREHARVIFIQPVETQPEAGRRQTLLTRDLSLTGIRLIGPRSLIGQKLHVLIARTDEPEPYRFLVRIVWTSGIGEDLFENGGMFLEVKE